jgi:hypothetical protein
MCDSAMAPTIKIKITTTMMMMMRVMKIKQRNDRRQMRDKSLKNFTNRREESTMLSLHLPADVTPRDVAKMMQMPGEIEVKDRSTFFNKYPNCFVAKEAVSWLVKRNLSRSREDAVSNKKKFYFLFFFFSLLIFFFFFLKGWCWASIVGRRLHLQRVARQRFSRQRTLLCILIDNC